jgi:RNA polymerase sigma factor (sigma-70 family)
VIDNVAGARRVFVRAFKRLVWFATHKVTVKRPDFDKDDVYMELWESVFERECMLLRKFRGESKFSVYFLGCLTFRAMDIARRISRGAACLSSAENLPLDSLLLPGCRPADPEKALCDKQARGRVRKVIHSLPGKQRAFFTMAFIEEAPTEKLVEEFGLGSANNAYKVRHRTLRLVQERVQRQTWSFLPRASRRRTMTLNGATQPCSPLRRARRSTP